MRSAGSFASNWFEFGEVEDLAILSAAIMALKALPWCPASVRDVRAFRVAQRSDFTELVRS